MLRGLYVYVCVCVWRVKRGEEQSGRVHVCLHLSTVCRIYACVGVCLCGLCV